MIMARPKTLISTPMNLARWAGGKTSPTIACEIGIMAPAPSPWKARKAISSVMLCDWPQSAEPTTKTTMPMA